MLSRNPIGVATHIKHPKDARKACGLSQSKMGRALGLVHPNGHEDRAYTRGAVSQWENDIYPMNADVQEAYRRVLVSEVARATDGWLHTSIRFGKRQWRVSV